MKKTSIWFRRTLFIIIMGLLLLPIIQDNTGLFNIKPLQGAVVIAPNRNLTSIEWFSGAYQAQKELYLNDGFGLRPLFIRLNNQLLFTFFNTARAQGIIIGKNNYLYEEGYIFAYNGSDCVGDSAIIRRMKKLQYVNEQLKKQNKTLLIVFAPGKASYYPEYIPDTYPGKGRSTNYRSYDSLIKKFDIHYVDFNSYFVENKSRFKYPIFPKYGIHWSCYAEALVADSLIRYIEHARNINMPHVFWHDLKMSTPLGRDADAEDAMNLVFNLKPDTLAYPTAQFESDAGKTKPSALVIGDSFFNSLYFEGIFRCFSKGDFWFDNHGVFNDDLFGGQFDKDWLHFYDKDVLDDYHSLGPHTGYNLRYAIATHDVIVIFTTDANLRNFSWNFIENAYEVLGGGHQKEMDPEVRAAKLRQIIAYIKNDPKWMMGMEVQAKDRKLSVDSTLMINAIYVLQQQQ